MFIIFTSLLLFILLLVVVCFLRSIEVRQHAYEVCLLLFFSKTVPPTKPSLSAVAVAPAPYNIIDRQKKNPYRIRLSEFRVSMFILIFSMFILTYNYLCCIDQYVYTTILLVSSILDLRLVQFTCLEIDLTIVIFTIKQYKLLETRRLIL